MFTDADKICRNRTGKRPVTGFRIAFLLLVSLAGCAGQAKSLKAPGLLYLAVSNHSHPLFAEVAQDVSSKRAPVKVTLDPRLEASSDFRLKLDFNILDKPLHDAEFVWTMSTIMMLGVYPASCARRELTLTADLYSRDGTAVKSWSIIESDTSYGSTDRIQTFHLTPTKPSMPNGHSESSLHS